MNSNMKKLIWSLPLWAGLALTACQEEAVPGKGPAADGTEGVLTLTLGGDASPTKAVGDYVPEGVTTAGEKEVRSLALFVKTEASGDEADFKPGAFARFLSESDKPEEQLSEPLTEVGGAGSGMYTCQVKVHSYSWLNPEVIAIANYKENEMETSLENLATWDELLELTTATPANAKALLACPLLMYGHSKISGWGSAPDGVPATQSVTLTRLAARIDVRNICYDKDDPANGFELESVTLCNSLSQSFVCPPADGTLTLGLPIVDRVTLEAVDIDVATESDRTFQRAKSLYTYETPNSGPTPTFLRLDGKYKGSGISVKAEFKNATADGKTEVVPIGRNHRYVVTLSNQLGDEAPKSDIEAMEWEAASEEMEAGPSAEAPVLSGWKTELAQGETGIAGSFNEATKTLDITNATAATKLSFKASGKGFVPDCYVTLRHDEGYDWNGRTVGEIKIEMGGFIRPEAYPGQFDREFTLTIPKRTADAAAEGTPPYEAWIYVYNSALGEVVTEIITVRADKIEPVPAP